MAILRDEKAELEQEIARLRAQLAAKKQVRLVVSAKGALSIYGLQRFPVTLYREQWEDVLDRAAEIRAFIAENSASLKAKE